MDILQTQKYAFILGRERELCLAELRAALGYFGFGFSDLIVSGNAVFINFNLAVSQLAVSELADILGGTIKIFEIISPMGNKIGSILQDYIQNHPKKEGKFNFALSSYTNKFDQRRLNSLGLEMKKAFKGKLSSRFVQLREGKEVSTILTYKSKLVGEGFEFGLFNESIGVLVAASNPEEWGERDYGKPAGDKYSGMLPPKLARAMINIALGAMANNQETITKEIENWRHPEGSALPGGKLEIPQHEVLVVDPFCGSGNILLEALMLGCDVFGSDNSEKAVKDSKKNVEWLINTVIPAKAGIQSGSQIKSGMTNRKFKIVQADAAGADLIKNLKLKIRNYNHLVVVSEPYLGEPKKYKPSMNAARGEYAKVKELYLSFLSNLSNLSHLNINPVLCLVFPLVETIEGKRFSLWNESVDEIVKIGYTLVRPPLVYGRDYQVVKRQIVLLQF